MMILLFDHSFLKADSCRGVRLGNDLFLFLDMISCCLSLSAFSKLVMWFSIRSGAGGGCQLVLQM